MDNSPDYLQILENHIDLIKVPFSDRGSRILLYRNQNKNSLYFKLAERLLQLDSNVEAYLRRQPLIQDFVFINARGEALDFEMQTSPAFLTFSTSIGDFGVAFEDLETITIGLPAQSSCGISFKVFSNYYQINGENNTPIDIRKVFYHCNGIIENQKVIPFEGGYEVQLVLRTAKDDTIALSISSVKPIAGQASSFSAAKSKAIQRWTEWFSSVPTVNPKYLKTYAFAWWVMANNLISPRGNVLYESMAPSKVGYVGLWLWDNAMHTLAYRHVDAELARNQIRLLLAHQLSNGMIPDEVFDDGLVTSLDHPISGEVTKPPILAWAVLKIQENAPDITFLAEVYPALVRLNDWWFNLNDDDRDGIAQYSHPYSSGLDDSPLWDYGMPVESPDLNTYLCLQLASLARIADILSLPSEAARWRAQETALVSSMISHFWDEEAGLFWPVVDNKPIKVVTPFSLYPLWTGKLPKNMNDRLITHLQDPYEFWGKYKIPTVARNDPHFDPKTMWRGPVWANINYFFIEALTLSGEVSMADELRESTLAMISAHKGIYEFYNADTGEVPTRAVPIFGWSSAVFIDLAIHASRKTSPSH